MQRLPGLPKNALPRHLGRYYGLLSDFSYQVLRLLSRDISTAPCAPSHHNALANITHLPHLARHHGCISSAPIPNPKRDPHSGIYHTTSLRLQQTQTPKSPPLSQPPSAAAVTKT
ncbi:uncharacterized protein BDZ99DRAFT_465614 [Mytilinidion resinicola]|uniref:Uncharacterized protein n=1 Tax=Mytilinidion resinicola TaxID=574789 RepID=A0A6A6YE83_9PEZI|nr:uncharacterized protein BDZ99DRAFT_465614 [Mytilinidion resinicola]KAF2806843.1 hypothetical protein BDZ99DRAFT_465614 [Mytilinidion resinicola]